MIIIFGVYPYTKLARTADIGESNYISFLTTSLPIQNHQGEQAAPYGEVAGYFDGDGETDDNESTHIIGHNPGAFNEMLKLKIGDEVTIVDWKKSKKIYVVYEIFEVDDSGIDREGINRWERIFDLKKESISLQTCIGEEWNRIVLAQ